MSGLAEVSSWLRAVVWHAGAGSAESKQDLGQLVQSYPFSQLSELDTTIQQKVTEVLNLLRATVKSNGYNGELPLKAQAVLDLLAPLAAKTRKASLKTVPLPQSIGVDT